MMPPEDPRIGLLLDLIVQLATGDLAARMELSPARDQLDALTAGVNMLGEELLGVYEGLEDRIAERTMALQRAHADLQRVALTDALTGLANRVLLADRMRQAIAAIARGAAPPAVLLADLDGFKRVNDSLGHGMGDAVLVEVARRLSTAVRDIDTVARLGGDEFAILLPDATADQALQIARRALDALRAPVQLGDDTVWVRASIGVRHGTPAQQPELLLRDADTAMYAAKAAGRGNVQVFDPAMALVATARMQASREIAAAISADQLTLYYQPVVALNTGAIVGAEALVRWRHPGRGLLLPEDFLPVAEASGLLADLGRWVIRAAVHQLRSWLVPLAATPAFQLHVNLSLVEVGQPGLFDYLRETLVASGVPAGRLAVDVAPYDAIGDQGAARDTLRKLHGLGVSIGIDGLPSQGCDVARLRRLQFPVDIVKLAPGDVTAVCTDPAAAAAFQPVRRLVDAGLRLVAKDVETADQVDRARSVGCAAGQGYHYSVAVPAGDMTALVRSGVLPTPRSAEVGVGAS